jgi:hypothetical protein
LLIGEVGLLLRSQLVLMYRETCISELLLKRLYVFALAQADLNFTIASADITNLILINCGLYDVFNA